MEAIADETRPTAVPASRIRCRYCGEVLTLNADGEAARAARTDPLQQMRRHIAARHYLQSPGHARRCGFLLDMLCFEAVSNPENWRKQLGEMIDFILKEDVE